MKRYIYSKYEDVLLDRLNQLNQQGYVLEKTGKFFKFSKTNNRVKYNIRYVKLEEIEGYQYVGEYKRAHFYYTNDVTAQDLPYDPETNANEHLNNYHLGFSILSVFISLFILPLSLSNLTSVINDFSKFYLDFPGFITGVVVASNQSLYIRFIIFNLKT